MNHRRNAKSGMQSPSIAAGFWRGAERANPAKTKGRCPSDGNSNLRQTSNGAKLLGKCHANPPANHPADPRSSPTPFARCISTCAGRPPSWSGSSRPRREQSSRPGPTSARSPSRPRAAHCASRSAQHPSRSPKRPRRPATARARSPCARRGPHEPRSTPHPLDPPPLHRDRQRALDTARFAADLVRRGMVTRHWPMERCLNPLRVGCRECFGRGEIALELRSFVARESQPESPITEATYGFRPMIPDDPAKWRIWLPFAVGGRT